MRILFVTQVSLDRPFGGARHVSALARELVRLRHRVTLVAPGREPAGEGVERIRPPAALRPGLRMEVALATLAATATMTGRFDVAYVRVSASSSLVPLALAARRLPVVLELNGRILAELAALGRPAWVVALARRSLRVATRAACAVVAVEPGIARHAETALGARAVHVVENGVDLEAATPGDRGVARQALGLEADRCYVAYTGTLAPEQRLDLLLDAQRARGSFTLLVAGGGPQAATIERAQAAGEVRWLGVVPHATAVQAIRAADVCVNVREGDVGMKGLEYAACGRRLVAFRVEGTERLEALYPGLDAVHLVDDRSAHALGEAIERALGAERARGPLPPAAIETARRTLGWDRTARRVAEVLMRARPQA
jgi:glycosyltransferase involved in cell wall biosynthesis